MIKGIGIDLVEIERIKNIEAKDAFVNKILTDNEKATYQSFNNEDRKNQFLSGRFAAKEAYAKAIGTGIGKTSFKDIEVLNDPLGKPYIHVKTYDHIHVSITHTDHYAEAIVIIEE